MKNTFYFMLKALFVLEILHFCTDFLVRQKNGLIKNVQVNSKIYDVTDWVKNNYGL